ncbi:MAG TPA: exosortase/archaeosortase family protein [Terriglobia bacterium]|nr:exosortase/archaeosortase family protein [Terriglobia bacterium]
MKRSDKHYLLFVLATAVVFFQPLRALLGQALSYDEYSHILVIPAISAFFIYWIDRFRIFQKVEPGWKYAAPLLALAGGLFWFARSRSETVSDGYFSLQILAIALLWVAGFLGIYGAQPFRVAAFPLFFLLLMVPAPASWLAWIVFALQQGSADASYLLFRLSGVPVFRDGFYFTVPGLTVEVAEQCSGIRSSTALLILGLLMGQVFLRTFSRKVFLILATIPILIFKNAVRIVAITLLSAYVSMDFLRGPLHTSGGILFFLLGLAVLVPIIHLLERSERWQAGVRRTAEAPREAAAP